MSYQSDYENALPFENLTIKQLQRIYPGAVFEKHNVGRPTKGTCPSDILMRLNGDNVFIEVKHDIASAKYGNICIEEAALLKGDSQYIILYADADNGCMFMFEKAGLLDKLTKDSRVIYKERIGDSKSWKTPHAGFLVPLKWIYKMGILVKHPPFDTIWLKEFQKLI